MHKPRKRKARKLVQQFRAENHVVEARPRQREARRRLRRRRSGVVTASGVELANVKMSMNAFCEIACEEAIRLKEKGGRGVPIHRRHAIFMVVSRRGSGWSLF